MRQARLSIGRDGPVFDSAFIAGPLPPEERLRSEMNASVGFEIGIVGPDVRLDDMIVERSVQQIVRIEHEGPVVEIDRFLSGIDFDPDLLDAQERRSAYVAGEIRVERDENIGAVLRMDAAEPAGVVHLAEDIGVVAVPYRKVVAVHVFGEYESVTERALDVGIAQLLLRIAPESGSDEARRIVPGSGGRGKRHVPNRGIDQYVIGIDRSGIGHVQARKPGKSALLGLGPESQILYADDSLVEAVNIGARAYGQQRHGRERRIGLEFAEYVRKEHRTVAPHRSPVFGRVAGIGTGRHDAILSG